MKLNDKSNVIINYSRSNDRENFSKLLPLDSQSVLTSIIYKGLETTALDWTVADLQEIMSFILNKIFLL